MWQLVREPKDGWLNQQQGLSQQRTRQEVFMHSFEQALQVIAGVMRDGVAKHPTTNGSGAALSIISAGPRNICGCCAMGNSWRTISPMPPHAC